MSKVRDIARFLGRTEDNNTDNNRILFEGEGGLDSAAATPVIDEVAGRIDFYSSLDSLPTTSLTVNTRAFVESNQRYYITNGSGWYNVALVNLSPRWDSTPLGLLDSTSIVDSATNLVIVAKALDSDNSDQNLFNQSFASDSAQYLVNISNDSSVWTFDPKSDDSISASVTAGDLDDSNENSFVYTFKWSDGINFVSKAITINYNFDRGANTYITPADWDTMGWNTSSPITNTSNSYGYTSSTRKWTHNTQAGNFDVLEIDLDMSAWADNEEWNLRMVGTGFYTDFSRRSYHVMNGQSASLDARTNSSGYYAQNRSDTGGWENGGSLSKTALAGSYTSLKQQIRYVKSTGTWTQWMQRNQTGSWTKVFEHTAYGTAGIQKVRVKLNQRTGTGLNAAPELATNLGS